MKKIICRCDAEVEVDSPDLLDLDADPAMLGRLARGDSPSAACPRCGAIVRAELPLKVRSASRGVDIVVLPEIERLATYRGKADPTGSAEILLGYQELFERSRMLSDGLDPSCVEALKYALQGKAEETEPEAEISVFYNGVSGGSLEFHILGLKSGQAGVVRLPMASYDRIAADLPATISKEPFKGIFAGRYRSIKKLGFLSSANGAD